MSAEATVPIEASTAERKTVLSCIQPTGDVHLGNYFGAVRNWVDLQNSGEYRCVYGIVDLHAMTMPYKPKDLKQNTENLVMDFLVAGASAVQIGTANFYDPKATMTILDELPSAIAELKSDSVTQIIGSLNLRN